MPAATSACADFGPRLSCAASSAATEAGAESGDFRTRDELRVLERSPGDEGVVRLVDMLGRGFPGNWIGVIVNTPSVGGVRIFKPEYPSKCFIPIRE